jgi:hypothetical protein
LAQLAAVKLCLLVVTDSAAEIGDSSDEADFRHRRLLGARLTEGIFDLGNLAVLRGVINFLAERFVVLVRERPHVFAHGLFGLGGDDLPIRLREAKREDISILNVEPVLPLVRF